MARRSSTTFPLRTRRVPRDGRRPVRVHVGRAAGAGWLCSCRVGRSALVATGFYADAVRKDGQGRPAGSEYPGTPALSLTYVSGIPGHKPKGPAAGAPEHGMQELGWLLPGETAGRSTAATVKFVGITKSTGLGVRKDFGLPLVWIGFIASMIGLSMIFYFPLQRSIVGFEAAGQGRSVVDACPPTAARRPRG